MSKNDDQVAQFSDSQTGLIPRKWEQLLTVAGTLVTLGGALASAIIGASLASITTGALILFVIFISSSIYFARRNPFLTQRLAALAGLLIAGVVAAHLYEDQQGKNMSGPAMVSVDPPRLVIDAWIDMPMIERTIEGKEVRLDGNGKRDSQEKSVEPIEVRASSHMNPTKLMSVPGQFNEFSPGDTIKATVCGLEFTKATYIRSDTRYADQIVWAIPVKFSPVKNC